jgi:hypothetical protein
MTAWIEGIDAAWGRPTPAQLVTAGKHFIVGYVSHDPGKNLSAAECAAYLDAGVAVGLVWETTSDRALDGAKAGGLDGRQARDQARALGFPDHLPIFAAVDFLASVVQLAGPVREYLAAFADAVGGVDLAGVYGGLDTVRYALNTRLVGWGWQTYAWSHGVWDERAYAQQYHNGVHIAGHDTDLDRAVDLSALWTKENTMAGFDAADAHYLLTYKGLPADTPTQSLGTAVLQAQNHAISADSKLDGLVVKLDALTAAVHALAAGGTSVDTAAVIAAINAVGDRETQAVATLRLQLAAAQAAAAAALQASP